MPETIRNANRWVEMADRAYPDALPADYPLHWYVLLRVLGQGGFGITYLARDTNLDQAVAIKEYLPIEMASRMPDATVRSRTEELRERYRWGLDRFIQEARTLARFDHPNIVRVHSVFEANDTAYMVMRFEEGQNLAALLDRRGTLPEPEVQRILLSVLDGLELVHRAGFIHRDIKPDNIHIRSDGSPVLLDFGSARHAIGKSRTMTILVAPGYAPLEQYYSDPEAQGPWTDIYGLAATCYRAIAGVTPLDAIARSKGILGNAEDVLVPASVIGRGRYSERLLRAIDHGLAFAEDERPQTIAEWREEIAGRPAPNPATRPAPQPQATENDAHAASAAGRSAQAGDKPQTEPKRWGRSFSLAPIVWSLAGGVVAAVTIAWLMRGAPSDPDAEQRLIEARVALEQERRRLGDERKRAEEMRLEQARQEPAAPTPDKPDASRAAVSQRPVRQQTQRQPDAPNARPSAEPRKAVEPAPQRVAEPAKSQATPRRGEDRSAAKPIPRGTPAPAAAPADVAPTVVEISDAIVMSSPAVPGQRAIGEPPAATASREPSLAERIAEAEALDTRGESAAAFALFSKLAQAGSARAQNRLAGMLLAGRGTARDDVAALGWYRKAAELRDGEAQFALGNLYASGRGVPKNVNQAYVWYSLAARNGYPGAEAARKRMLAFLQPAEVAQADKLVAARSR